MRRFAAAGLISAMALACAPAPAQDARPAAAPAAAVAPVQPARPPARAADVATVDSIIAALYDVISGGAGQARDWDRLRSLFAPEGRMAAIGMRPGGEVGLRSMLVDEYIARSGKMFAEIGFYESEMARTTETFGQLVHVFSTYQARHAPADAQPFVRGVNSIQLYHDGARWHIVSVLWRAEDPKLQLPERYLKSR